jgi:hypothetical protein
MPDTDFEPSRKSFQGDKSDDRLLSDDSNDVVLTRRKRASDCSRILLYIGCAIITLVIALLATANITLLFEKTCKSASSIPLGSILHCGHSPEQAEALGCVFDILDCSRTPKPCFNATLSDKYWDDQQSLGLTFGTIP